MTVAGINLSQSIQEKQAQAQVKFFDRGLITGVVLLVFVAIATGGLHWYVGTLETKMTELDTLIAQKTATLKGQSIDRLVDFSDRMTTISTHVQSEPNPTDVLEILEDNTLASIQIISFRYNRAENQLILTGITRSLKEVAQQMLVLKNLDVIENVGVSGIVYAENGDIKFTLTLKEKKVASVTTP